jgi:ribonuclease HI
MSVKNIYATPTSTFEWPQVNGWENKLWKWEVQLKKKLFIWMVVENKILTWQVLQGKGWQGPDRCPLCKVDNEDVDHLLVHCQFTQSIWGILSICLNQNFLWNGQSLTHYFESWVKDKCCPINLAVHLCCFIWAERNQVLFKDKSPSCWAVIIKTLRNLCPCNNPKFVNVIKWSPMIQDVDHIIAFFDGASIMKGRNCGAGGVFKFSAQKACRWHINGGSGTHSKAELLGAWVTLTIAKLWNITKLKILGDLKVIIVWLNKKCILNDSDLEGWKHRTKDLSSLFQEINYLHIYGEYNKESNHLSKQALLGPSGRLTYYHLDNGKVGPPTHIKPF